jgi:hypothetical protein
MTITSLFAEERSSGGLAAARSRISTYNVTFLRNVITELLLLNRVRGNVFFVGTVVSTTSPPQRFIPSS